jgi:translation initiation factor IF-1
VLHPRSVGLVIQKEHNVPKEELLEFEGLVTEILPDARYRVQLDNGHELVAYTAGRMRKNRIKTLAGDRVTVEVSPYDLEKGRLIFRHKDERANGSPSAAASPVSAAVTTNREPYDAIALKDRTGAVPVGRNHLPANKLCKRRASRCRSRMPSRCLPLPRAPHSDCHCIACDLGRHRHMRGGFGRDRRRFPMRTAANPARMSSTHHRVDNLRR